MCMVLCCGGGSLVSWASVGTDVWWTMLEDRVSTRATMCELIEGIMWPLPFTISSYHFRLFRLPLTVKCE